MLCEPPPPPLTFTPPMCAVSKMAARAVARRGPTRPATWILSCALVGAYPFEIGFCEFIVRKPIPRAPVRITYRERPGTCTWRVRLRGNAKFSGHAPTTRGTCVVVYPNRKGVPAP